MKQVQKIIYFDFARSAATIAVVTIHTFALLNTPALLSSSWWIHTLATSLSIWAVPLFVMISGALLLTKVEPPTLFYYKRIVKIVFPTFFWLFVYFAYTQLVLEENLSIFLFLKRVLFGEVGHLYFLLLILELYAITPFLRTIVSKLSQTEVLFLIGLFFCIAAFWGLSRFSVTLFIPYIGFYLAGYYLTKYPTAHRGNSLLNSQSLAIVWLLLVSAIFTSKLVGDHFGIVSYYYFTHGNPLLIALTICTFIGFQRIKLNASFIKVFSPEKVNQFSVATFGIYIIHPLVLSMLQKYFLPNKLDWYLPLVVLPFVVFVSYLLSRLFATISACLQKKYSWLRLV